MESDIMVNEQELLKIEAILIGLGFTKTGRYVGVHSGTTYHATFIQLASGACAEVIQHGDSTYEVATMRGS
jgi:hypothetical protein